MLAARISPQVVTWYLLFLGENFEILTDFSSLGISFFFSVCPHPSELGFSVLWPQGSAESRAKQSQVRALRSQLPALGDPGRTAVQTQ